MSKLNAPLPVDCRACYAKSGDPCTVEATGAKATKNHNVRIADAAEYVARLDTPDTQTADEFSENNTGCTCVADLLGDTWHTEGCPEYVDPQVEAHKVIADIDEYLNGAEVPKEKIQWVEAPASDVEIGDLVRDSKGGIKGTVAALRIGAKWTTALDSNMNTLIYAPTESGRVYLFR